MVKDETNEELKKIVLEFGSYSYSAAQETKRRALQRMQEIE